MQCLHDCFGSSGFSLAHRTLRALHASQLCDCLFLLLLVFSACDSLRASSEGGVAELHTFLGRAGGMIMGSWVENKLRGSRIIACVNVLKPLRQKTYTRGLSQHGSREQSIHIQGPAYCHISESSCLPSFRSDLLITDYRRRCASARYFFSSES